MAAILIFVFLVLTVIHIDTHRFVVKKYIVKSDKIKREHTVVFLSDLHEKEYGKKNEPLLKAIHEEKPDIILVGGDMVVAGNARFEHEQWFEQTASLLTNLSQFYPIYMVDGNHEMELKTTILWDGNTLKHCWDSLYGKLEKAGVMCVHNEKVEWDGINIYGLELDMQYYGKATRKVLTSEDVENLIGKSDCDKFNILLTHNPLFFTSYVEWGADLTLAGHLHGGIIRIGRNGILGANRQFFPKYSNGRYKLNFLDDCKQSEMIVSSGLGIHTLPIRLFNPGEVVVVNVCPL